MTLPEYIAVMLGVLGVILVIVRSCMGFRRTGIVTGGRGIEIGASKTIGTREIQEDEYAIQETDEGVMAVMADGMGKHYGGKIAARAAVEAFQDIFEDNNAFYNPQYYFRKAFQGANREILRLLEDGQGHASVASVLIKDRKMYYASAGNVKIAVYRNHELVPVTAGHTMDMLAQKKYEEGRLTREQAQALLDNHRLYNYVGQDGFRDVEFFDVPVTLRGGDHILLMTDGMYEGAGWRDIEECLGQGGTSQEKAFMLVELINRSTEEDRDNASVVVLKVKGSGY